MEYKVEAKEGETVYMSVEESETGITKFWEKVNNNGAIDILHEVKSGEAPNTHGRIIGVWQLSEADDDSVIYTIGTEYMQGSNIYPLKIIEVPEAKWMVFKCKGAVPAAMGKSYHEIFDNVLPQTDYKISTKMFLEIYNISDAKSDDYHFEIWVPISEA